MARYCLYIYNRLPLRILGVAPIEGEKGVALKVGETGASHLTPLHAPVNCVDMTV